VNASLYAAPAKELNTSLSYCGVVVEKVVVPSNESNIEAKEEAGVYLPPLPASASVNQNSLSYAGAVEEPNTPSSYHSAVAEEVMGALNE
jgi:hypothetical protein